MTKIYHYEPYYKFLLHSEEVDSSRSLPAHATNITPPLEFPVGQIPVFENEQWNLVKDDFWRPKSIEVNYDAGRSSSTYEPLNLSIYSGHLVNFPSMPMLCNGGLVQHSIIQKNRMIHKKFEQILASYNAFKLTQIESAIPADSPDYKSLAIKPTDLFEMKLETESMVFLMRRILDSLVQITYLLTNWDDYLLSKRIAFNEIGAFLSVSNTSTDIAKIILGDDFLYESDKTGFLPIINDLFNSFKHCLIHDESYSLFGETIPTIVTYQAKYNDHKNEIAFHNHNAFHLMMGYQDTVLRILKNQKQYVASKNIDP